MSVIMGCRQPAIKKFLIVPPQKIVLYYQPILILVLYRLCGKKINRPLFCFARELNDAPKVN